MKEKQVFNIKKSNSTLIYSGQDIFDVLTKVEYILISLHKIGSYYGNLMHDNPLDYSKYYDEYCKETTKYIDNNKVTAILSSIRTTLSRKVDDSLDEKDMSDLDYACEKIEFWEFPKKSN